MTTFQANSVGVIASTPRVFHVHEVDDQGMLRERHPITSQQPFVIPMHPNHVVWCPDLSTARKLVDTLQASKDGFRKRITALQDAAIADEIRIVKEFQATL